MRPFLRQVSSLVHHTTTTAGARAALPRTVRYAAKRPAVSSSGVQTGTVQSATRRLLSNSVHRSRQYQRFEMPSSGQPGQRPDLMQFARRRLGGDRATIIYGLAIAGGVTYYVVHLERVPETGRLRFMDCSAEQEKEIGMASFNETMEQFGGKILPAYDPRVRRVTQIAKRIIEDNGLGKVRAGGGLSSVSFSGAMDDLSQLFGSQKAEVPDEWEVFVVDDPKTKNAFVIPGGKIFVFTGILPVSGNDDGLATVMGHEIAHVVARHGAERMSMMKVLLGVSLLLESLGLDVGLTRLLVTFLLQLPNSRTNESEADNIGLRLMARACFNPEESTRMWERMSEEDGGGKIDFMSTHPANRKRIKALAAQLPEADQMRAEKCGVSDKYMPGFQEATGTKGSATW